MWLECPEVAVRLAPQAPCRPATQTPCKKRKADAFTDMLDDKLDDALLKDSVREIVCELHAKPEKILYTLSSGLTT